MFINIKKIRHSLWLFKKAYSGYRIQILGITGLGFVSGLSSGIGISMLIPIFSLVAGKENTGSMGSLPNIIGDVFNFFHLSYNLPIVLTLMIFLFALKALIALAASYINERVGGRYLEDMRLLSFKRTLGADWPYLMNQKVGYLDRIISDDATQAAGILKNISDTILRFTSLAVYTFIALNISVSITLISLGGGALVFILLKPFLYKVRKLSEFLSRASKEMSHIINESLIAMKTIKASAVEPTIINKSRVHLHELEKAQVKWYFLSNLQGILFEPVSLIFISFIFAFSYKSPSFNLASFVVIIYLIQKIFSFIQAIQGKVNTINGALPYLDSMLAYQESTLKHQEKSSDGKNFQFNDILQIKDITFTYPETDKRILSNLNFSIKRGEMLGIIGPSGSGKTTLVDILLRLFKPQEGIITSDDTDISLINLSDWRKNVGYVPQDAFLINDTIKANINFYNHSVGHNEILSASKMANIYSFIQELPDKFDTQAGERGVKLSGGQKQRIALARALARKPSILILDEATSALDNESETLIQEAINNLKGRITVIIIAHRLSTIMNADSLIVLENGKIVDTGTPEELMKDKNSYLYKSYHKTSNQE